jgi:O-methyltransferase domain/Dimerisation domain
MDKGAVLDIIFGRWRSQIAYAGVKLGIFEAIGREGKDAAVIAKELRLDPVLSYRLLRALACLGLLREEAGRRFSLTSAGEFLRADHPETLRGITLLEEGPEHYAIWRHLPDMIRDGRQNAFVREFGHTAFEHPARHPEYFRAFDEAMSSYSSTEAAGVIDALRGHDLSKITHMCDVGGGHGYLLCSLLTKHPHMRGTLLERAEVLRDERQLWSKKMSLTDRCAHVPGDMFASVPSADAYIMKHIIHDWNDDECVRIFSNIHKAAPPDARIFIAEYIVTGPDTPHFAKLFDIHMMCWGTGRERTSEEYAALLERAGWKYVETLYPSAGAIGVVEGVRR